MTANTIKNLRGMTWNHDRGIAPLLAVSEEICRDSPDLKFSWDARPLQDFESQPLRELAKTYDLIIIDHPHLGEAVREGLLLDLASCGRDDELALLAKQSVGRSHESYRLSGGHWALAVDAATPVASYRPDKLEYRPKTWREILEIAQKGQAIMPLRAPHTLMAFFWLARNRDTAIAQNPDKFMEQEDMAESLDQLAELAGHLGRECFEMDPIAVYEAMSNELDGPLYCPHAYGYISYSRDRFRPHTLGFTNVADVAGGGVSGTVLGGTGIAVSALSSHKDIATDFAFRIANPTCQSNLWIESGGQPGNAVAWEDAESNVACNNFLKNTRATLEAAWIRPRYEGYLSFQTTGSQCIAEFLKGSMTQRACITALDDQYRSSLA